jgi:hypothetical protein
MINGKGSDPGMLLHSKLITITHESSSHQVFHPFYEEMQNEFPVSVRTKNLFLSLAKSIAQTLNVTSCYVCGGTSLGGHWPWEAKELDPQEPFNETAFPNHRKSIWLLKNVYHWELLYLPHKRPVLHTGRGFNLFRVEVLP